MHYKKLITIALLAIASAPAFAAQCSVEVEGSDAMQFNLKNIDVSQSCKQFTVRLKHTGKMTKNIMGHNWVLSKASDEAGVVADGSKTGLAADYIKAGDSRVIAHTNVVGGGESTSITFPVSKLKAGDSYTYFCSFPGHATMMKGTLKLVK